MFWISAALSVILVGIAKAGFGAGVGVIATPLMALTIPVPEAAALLLPLLIIVDLFSIRHYWGVYDGRSLKILLPGALAGIALGAAFFGYFADNDQILRIGIGVLSIAFVLFQLVRGMVLGAIEKSRPPAGVGVLLGGVSGFTSTLAHAGGPPAVMYLLPQQLPRNLFVGTTVFFFAAVNAIKLIPYGYLGLLRVGNLTTVLILAPLAYVGVRLGLYLNRNFTDTWFNRLIYTLLFLTGLQLILGKSLVELLLGA